VRHIRLEIFAFSVAVFEVRWAGELTTSAHAVFRRPTRDTASPAVGEIGDKIHTAFVAFIEADGADEMTCALNALLTLRAYDAAVTAI
jgi:hypothetical protein